MTCSPKIIDFGLAMLPWMGSLGNLTGAVVFGTPDYMAPEQAIASDEVDVRVDIWSYCVVLYEMLSGTLPSASSDFPAALSAMEGDAKLWAILERGLRKNPEERWPTMQQLGASLADWLRSHGIAEDATGASLRTRWPIEQDGPLELSGAKGPATFDSRLACRAGRKVTRGEGRAQADCR